MNAECGEWEMEKQNNRKLKQLSKLSGMLDRLRKRCAQRVSKCPKCPKCNLLMKTLIGRPGQRQNSSVQRLSKLSKTVRLSAMLYWPHGQNIGVQSGWRGQACPECLMTRGLIINARGCIIDFANYILHTLFGYNYTINKHEDNR